LSGATGGLVAYTLNSLATEKHSLFAFSRGLVAGLVVVSA